MKNIALDLACAFMCTVQSDDLLDRCKLGKLTYAGTIQVDTPLLIVLAKMWDQNCYSFHLPIGEMIVMLKDVY